MEKACWSGKGTRCTTVDVLQGDGHLELRWRVSEDRVRVEETSGNGGRKLRRRIKLIVAELHRSRCSHHERIALHRGASFRGRDFESVAGKGTLKSEGSSPRLVSH